MFYVLVDFGTSAGESTSGDAEGGRGNGKGPGGNAYSGFAGPTRGGNVVDEGGNIDNTGVTSRYFLSPYRMQNLTVGSRHWWQWRQLP